MDDLISRQAAIELIHSLYPSAPIMPMNRKQWKKKYKPYIEAEKALEMLPSAQPEPSDVARNIATIIENEKDMRVVLQQPQWIPCSERLPEEYGNYLVSIRGEEPDIGTINPKDERGWSLCDATGFYWASEKKLDVIAWMPLPESYRGDSNG